MKFEPSKQSIAELYYNPKVIYLIPQYQRPYSWEKVNWDELFITIKNNDNTYIGTVIYNTNIEDQNSKEIIDGQQRYLTITILFAALRDLLMEIDKANGREISVLGEKVYVTHIGETDVFTEENKFFLKPGGTISKYFTENIQKISNEFFKNTDSSIELSSGSSAEEILVYNAYYFFKEKIKEELIKSSPKEVYKMLYDGLGNLFVVRIEIDDYSMAFEIFETVNSYGVDLSVADLIKNQIFKNLNSNLLKAEEKWNAILQNIASDSISLSMKEFLRYYWASKYEYVSDSKLYKAIKTKIGHEKSRWDELLDELLNNSILLTEIVAFSKEDWQNKFRKDEGAKIYKHLKALQSVKGKTWMVLALSIFRNMDEIKDFGFKIHKQIEKFQEFTYFYFTIMGYPSNWYWKTMYNFAQKIENSKTKIEYNVVFVELYREFATQLKDVHIESFANGLKNIKYSATNKAGLYYLLGELELHLQGDHGSGFDGDRVNIEHFIPQQPKEWNLTKTEIKENVNLLGNLLLIPSKLNGALGNKSYHDKIEIIKKSEPDMRMLIELITKSESGEWPFHNFADSNQEAVSLRQKRITEIAYEIWVDNLRKKMG